MAKKHRSFLNLAVDEALLARLDETAEKSGLDRSKQARALLEFGLSYTRKVYIPAAESPRLPFNQPLHEAPAKRTRKRRKAA